MNAQEFLWRYLDQAGGALWLIQPILCAAAFAILVLRAPPDCWMERIGRMLCLLGLAMIALSPANTALGFIGGALFFTGYLVTLEHRRRVETRSGRVRPPSSRPPPALLAAAVVALVAMIGLMPTMARAHDPYTHWLIR